MNKMFNRITTYLYIAIFRFIKRHCVLLCLFICGFVYFSYCQYKAEVNSNLNRNDYYVVCRDNDAVVLDCSPFLPKGTVHVFGKDKNGKFTLVQRIDLAKYLRRVNVGFVTFIGDHVDFIESDQKGQFETFFIDQPLAYNDLFLAVMTRHSNIPESYGFYIGDALIFKKNRGKFRFHKRIKDVYPNRVALSQDNQLILSEVRGMFYSNEGSLRCYNLSEDGVELVQTIKLPAEIKDCCGNLIKSADIKLEMGVEFQQNADLLLVSCSAMNGRVIMTENDAPYSQSVDGYLLYKRNSGAWKFFQSTYEIIPRDIYLNSKHILSTAIYNPFHSTIKIDMTKDMIQFSCINRALFRKHLIELVRNCDTGTFEFNGCCFSNYVKDNVNEDENFHDSYDDSTRVNLVIQCRQNYSLSVMNKSTELGISPPSFDNNPGVVPPKWIIPSGNKTTMALMVDYYSNNYVTDFVPKIYNNFYEYVNYVPVLHYWICNDNLVVTYVFKDCFFKDGPMQRPDIVWAGVDFYKLDPERGPIKTSSFTTSNLEPLKEAPVEELP